MKKNTALFILRTIISVSLLVLLLWLGRENLGEIQKRLCSVKIPVFLSAFFIYIISTVFMAWRLKVILAEQKAFFTIKDVFSLTLIGYFFTNFMPTSVGGDLIKGYYLSKRNKTPLIAYTSVFIDRALGMFSVAIIAGIGLIGIGKDIEHKFIIWLIGILLLSSILFIISIQQKKLIKKLGNLFKITRLLQILKLQETAKHTYQSLVIYLKRKEIFLKIISLSIIAQFIAFISIFMLSKSFSIDMSFIKIILIMPIIFILCMLPVTINGLGLREWAFVFFFGSSIGEAEALSLSVLYLAMYLLLSILGGITYLFKR